MTAEAALSALGFTELETRLYCELLKQAPATGYRLAQAVGKAPANTYQALGSLTQKGAVVVDDGATKSFRPVPPAELLATLRRRFTERHDAAKAALEQIHAPVPSDKIYQLKNVAQVLERASQMIVAAQEIILFDLFPEPFRSLQPLLAEAAARGVRIAGLVYSHQVAPTNVHCVLARGKTAKPRNWPGAQLTLVVDATEFLVALLAHEGAVLHHGLWSDSVYISCLQHNGLACEIRLSALRLQGTDSFAKLSLLAAEPPGLRTLELSSKRIDATKPQP